MQAIFLPDDALKRLEEQFGPAVRQMGSWNSDGSFGYSSVPIVAVEKAAETLEDPALMQAFLHLRDTADQTRPFIELLETFGTALIEGIVAANRDRYLSFSQGRVSQMGAH